MYVCTYVRNIQCPLKQGTGFPGPELQLSGIGNQIQVLCQNGSHPNHWAIFLALFLFLFWDKSSLFALADLEFTVDQNVFKLTETDCLRLPSAGVKSVHHHAGLWQKVE